MLREVISASLSRCVPHCDNHRRKPANLVDQSALQQQEHRTLNSFPIFSIPFRYALYDVGNDIMR